MVTVDPVYPLVDVPLLGEQENEVTVGGGVKKAPSLPIAKYCVPVVMFAAVRGKLLLLATVNGLLPVRVAACCIHVDPL